MFKFLGEILDNIVMGVFTIVLHLFLLGVLVFLGYFVYLAYYDLFG